MPDRGEVSEVRRDGADMSMTKAEFEAFWCRGTDMPVADLRRCGLHAEPCDCEEDGCRGWQMIRQAVAEFNRKDVVNLPGA